MSFKTTRARRVLLSTLASLLACVPGPIALAVPQGALVVAGSAVVSTSGNTTTINQSSNRAIINWNSFSINPNETVNFALPSSSSAVLNRVTSLSPSLLNGNLQSNGAVYLINPNGIIVGPHGVINTQSFVASALDTNNQTFMSGGDQTFSGDSTASVINQGRISTPNGDVVFMAQQVRNDGTIIAPGGSADLVAGSEILLQQAGTPGLTVRVLGGNGSVTNTGLIQTTLAQLAANGGNAMALAINNTGIIRATDVNQSNGRILLTAGSGEAENSGTLDASSATGNGGQVTVTGQDIMIDGSSHITANGATGGGLIQIGGSWENDDPTVAQAVGTIVQSGALLEASATQLGNGGTIVVRSDVSNANSLTRAYGTLLANGGPLGGNGGNIETSGHSLDATGAIVSAAAPNGAAGQWLLDPFDLVINNTATSGINETGNPWVPTASGGNVDASDIDTALNGGSNVTIATTAAGSDEGNITVNAAVTKSSGATPVTFTLEADNNILVNQSITDTATGALNVVLDADFDASQQGNIQVVNSSIITNGGSITLGGGATPLSTPAYGDIGGGSIAASSGVFLNQATLASGGGNISIIGTGSTSSSPNNAVGVMAEYQTDISSGTGTIAITGIGAASGATGNMGVNIRYENSLGAGGTAGTTGSTISSANTTANAIVISGTGSTTGALNSAGVTLQDGSSVIAIGTGGGIVINGTGGTFADSTSPGNRGISLDTGITIDSTNGNLTLNGTSPAGVTSIFDYAGANTIFASASTGTLTLNPTNNGVNLAPSVITAADLLLTGAGTYTLTDASNAVGTLAGNVASGNVQFIDNQSLTIGDISGTAGLADTGGSLSVQTTGGSSNLTLANNVSATGNNTTVVLAAGQNFLNTGSATIGTGSGRFLIYSATPTNDVLGGLAGGELYNTTYTADPPSNIVQVGNQFLYSIQPTITFTENPVTNVYGMGLPTLDSTTYTVTGLLGTDTLSAVTSGGPTVTTTATSQPNVGVYPITITQGSLASSIGYIFNFVGNNFTVTPAPLTISDNQTVTYGATSIPTLAATATGLQYSDTLQTIGLTSQPTLAFTSGGPTAPVTAPVSTAPYPITVTSTGGTAANYNITYVNGAMTIAPAPLTITVDDQTITYGGTIPTFTSDTPTGFVNGDTAGTVTITGLALGAPTLPTGNPAGSYPIQQTGTATAPNYAITVVPGTLTINPALLTISFSQSDVYNGDSPSLDAANITYTTLVNGDTSAALGSITPTLVDTNPPTNVGTYSVTVTGGSDPNYTITNSQGTLSITPATVTINPLPATTTYGSAPTFTSASIQYVGLPTDGDQASAISGPTVISTAPLNTPVGVDPGVITVSGASDTNYTFIYGSPAALTITPAPLTITANNTIRYLGQPNPTFTAAYTTLLGGDQPSAITGLTFSTTATGTSPVGTYSIVPSGGTDPNYDITFADGILTVGAVNVNDVQQEWQVNSAIAPSFGTDSLGQSDSGGAQTDAHRLLSPVSGTRRYGNVFFDTSNLTGSTEPLSLRVGPEGTIRKAVVHVSSFGQNSGGDTGAGGQ